MFSDKLKKLRNNVGLSQKALAESLFVSQQAVAKWEKGKSTPDPDMVVKIADILNVTTDILLGNEEAISPNTVNLPDNMMQIKTYSVPLVGTIACGSPILAEENIEDYVRVSEDIRCDFALRFRGDSMINVRIFDGDIVYIRQQPTVENGEIAAVLIDDEATLKKVYVYPNRIELRAENPTFKALEYEGEQLNRIKILGKAVAFFSLVR